MLRSTRRGSRLRLPLVLLAVAIGVASCHVRTVSVRPLTRPPSDSGTQVSTPVKAHLIDGSTLHFPSGVALANGVLRGTGQRFGLRLEPLGAVEAMSLDSVVGMESYEFATNAGATLILSVLGTLGAAALAGGAAVAIFGSCPTFYSDSAGTWQLEAEGFSYSIAAMFESRDVDRLRTTTAADGSVQIEVRNEALETHYINHLELLDVRHAADEIVLPDAAGRPVAVRQQLTPLRANDRAGRNLLGILATADGATTRSDRELLERSGGDDIDDFIDLTVPVPPGADSVALVLRLRNSLLNTVLLYDVMLGSRGLKSLEWQSTSLREIGPALEVAQWYSGNMGLRVLEVTGNVTREVARLRDTGPIAWKDVALMLPAPRTATMHLRLEYVVDNWRIDRLTIAAVRRPAIRRLPLAAAIDSRGQADVGALASLAAPDTRYLQTIPGQRFTAVWHPERLTDGTARTFLLASQGYYIEWMRRDWLATPRDTTPFRPSRQVIANAVSIWRTVQDSLERDFHNSRLPVR